MAFVISNIRDLDGEFILASCPFYSQNPLCVNSCALFEPELQVIGESVFADYRRGRCSLSNGRTEFMDTMSDEAEAAYRQKKGYE